jgi:hypothetical protein
MTLTFEDGKVFQLPAGWSDPQDTPEDQVTITCDVQGGEELARKAIIDENCSGDDAE